MSEPAHLLLAEYDAVNPWWYPDRYSAGSATIVQQFSEATHDFLRRVTKSAQDLRKAGFGVDSAYFVLGQCDEERFPLRVAAAQYLSAVLEPSLGTLHLVATALTGRSTPFLLADQLYECRSLRRLKIHFPSDPLASPQFMSNPGPSGATARLPRVA